MGGYIGMDQGRDSLALQPLHVEVSAYSERKKLHTAVLAMDSSVPSCMLSESPKRSLKSKNQHHRNLKSLFFGGFFPLSPCLSRNFVE